MADTLKEKIADVVDSIGGPGTANKIEGATNELLGQAQEKLGEVFDDEDLKDMGARKKKRGEVQQAIADEDQANSAGDSLGEVVKSEAEQIADATRERAKQNIESIKDAIKDTAETVKGII